MENDNQITTTVNINPSDNIIETIFRHIDKYIVGDLLTMDNIVGCESHASTYCTVPQTQAIFGFVDLMGYLFRDNKSNTKNPETETFLNIEFFLQNSLSVFLIMNFVIRF